MPWIESHQKIERHYKTYDLMTFMGWDIDTTIGKLHRFWWWCMDYAEDGNLSNHPPHRLGAAVGLQGEDANKFLRSMIKAGFIDKAETIIANKDTKKGGAEGSVSDPVGRQVEPSLMIHDWWDYVGRFLQVKYRKTPEKWKYIKGLYKGDRDISKGVSKGTCYTHIPNLTNLTNLTYLDPVCEGCKMECSGSKKQAVRLAFLLAELILKNDSNYFYLQKTKYARSVESYAMEIDKLFRINKAKAQDIESVIRWCQSDDFWKSNILSGSKLREKYPQIKIKMQSHITRVDNEPLPPYYTKS